MKTDEFDYKLPKHLIAYFPEQRGKEKLLILDRNSGKIEETLFNNIVNILPFPICIVRNITKVVKVRIFAKRITGANIEILILNPYARNNLKALINRGGRLKIGEKLIIDNNNCIIVKGRHKQIFDVEILTDMEFDKFFEYFGHVPLPPYIKREDNKNDVDSYQTVFSKVYGSVAAPTAGLHFSESMIDDLKKRGAIFIDILLHIGLGTFESVKSEHIEQHKMHKEYYFVDKCSAEKLNNAKRNNIPILAIGTTSLRVLETIYRDNKFNSEKGFTDIFIYPPYKIKTIDMLLTNFHLPKSTLIMLVSAFANRDNIMKAYHYAIEHNYRFFSYGDAMLIK